MVRFGGLLGEAPVMPVNKYSPRRLIERVVGAGAAAFKQKLIFT